MGARRTTVAQRAVLLLHQWVPGTALLAAAVGVGAVLGYTAAAGRPPVYLSIAVAALIVSLGVTMLRQRRERRALGLTREATAGHAAPRPCFDLARDTRTHSQKYVM